jgi:hypothetical protein
MPVITRVYPEKSLRFLLSDPFWYSGRMHQRNDDVLPSARKPIYGRQSKENKPREPESSQADR